MMRRASFGMDPRRGFGVDGLQPLVQVLRTALRARPRVLALEALAQPGVGGAGRQQTFEERTNVEAGSARQYDDLPARMDGGRRPAGLHHVAAGVVGHVRGHHVDQVVRHARALLRRRLRGPDVHEAVDLHRVGVHDLAAELLGQLDRERGLARRRRSGDDDHGGPGGSGGSGGHRAGEA